MIDLPVIRYTARCRVGMICAAILLLTGAHAQQPRAPRMTSHVVLEKNLSTNEILVSDVNGAGRMLVIDKVAATIDVYDRDAGRFLHRGALTDAMMQGLLQAGEEPVPPQLREAMSGLSIDVVCLYDEKRFAVAGSTAFLRPAHGKESRMVGQRPFYVVYDPQTNSIEKIAGLPGVSALQDVDLTKHSVLVTADELCLTAGSSLIRQKFGAEATMVDVIDLRRNVPMRTYSGGPTADGSNVYSTFKEAYITRMNGRVYALRLLGDSLYDPFRNTSWPIGGHPVRPYPAVSASELGSTADGTSAGTYSGAEVSPGIQRFTPGLVQLGPDLLGVRYLEMAHGAPTTDLLLLFNTKAQRRVGFMKNPWLQTVYDARTGEFGGFRKEGEDLIVEFGMVLPE